MNLEDTLSDILCDALDIKAALPEDILNKPKDNDGSEFTVGDCIDNVIHRLEEMSLAIESEE
jgi:hypothetical protein